MELEEPMTKKLLKQIEQAVIVLREEGATEIYIFGSAASGKMHRGSDLDLAVCGLPPERFFRIMSRVSEVVELPFDLIDLDEVNPFTKYLRHEGEMVRVG